MLRHCPDLMTVKDVQTVLNIGRTTAYKLVESGELPTLRIGRIYRIPKIVAEYERAKEAPAVQVLHKGAAAEPDGIGEGGGHRNPCEALRYIWLAPQQGAGAPMVSYRLQPQHHFYSSHGKKRSRGAQENEARDSR